MFFRRLQGDVWFHFEVAEQEANTEPVYCYDCWEHENESKALKMAQETLRKCFGYGIVQKLHNHLSPANLCATGDCGVSTSPMAETQEFKAAFPYQKDFLELPVTSLDTASEWYSKHFGMIEVERHAAPVPTRILERDGTRIGFAINGGNASQDGSAILVSNIQGMKDELESRGVEIGSWRVDERILESSGLKRQKPSVSIILVHASDS